MRLQGAIFHLPGALLDETGAPRNGVKEFLSVMKMEGVWMYGVTAQPLEECLPWIRRGLPPIFGE